MISRIVQCSYQPFRNLRYTILKVMLVMKILQNGCKSMKIVFSEVASYICIAYFYFFTDRLTQLKKAKQQVLYSKAVVLATAATVLAVPLFSQSTRCIHLIRKLLV